MPTDYDITFEGTPPTRWKLATPHEHSGEVVQNDLGYWVKPPAGGWPSCCPNLHQSVKRALQNEGYE